MKETIYTIPINEAFDRRCGCPLCRLRQELEQKSLDYVMGAAMMEPDVRIATNAAGFCREHFSAMLAMKNRLSLALMMQSHLKEVASVLGATPSSGGLLGGGKKTDPAETLARRCYVCERVDDFMEKYISNIIFLYHSESTFREKLLAQPFYCVPHFAALRAGGMKELRGKERDAFLRDLAQVEHRYLQTLQDEVDTFCKSFDYRYTDLDLSSAKTSCEKSGDFLTGAEKSPL